MIIVHDKEDIKSNKNNWKTDNEIYHFNPKEENCKPIGCYGKQPYIVRYPK